MAGMALVGTGLGLHVEFPPCWWILSAALCSGLAWAGRRSGFGVWSLHLGLLFAFALAARLHSPDVDGRSLAALMQRPEEHLALVGRIDDAPVRLADAGAPRWRFPLRLEGVRRGPAWQRSAGRLLVTTVSEADVAPAYGQRLLVHGRVALDAEPRRGSQQGILGTVRPDRGGLLVLSGFHGNPLLRACLWGRAACARLLSRGIERDVETTGLLNALMLGYREDLSGRSNNAFARTGTLHIVAISGSHVGIMAMLLVGLLKSAGWSRPHWVYAVAPLLILYTLATGMAASALRACLMAVVFWSAGALRRRPDGPSALAFAALVILACSPGQLVDPGFLLSFGVVAGLMVFCPPLMQPLEPWLNPDPWSIEIEPWPLRAARWCLRHAVALVVLTVAAWFVSTPMTARFFNLVSPVGLVANLVVVPLSFFILLTGCLSLMVGPWWGWMGEVFNHANRVFVGAVLRSVEGFDRLPGGSFFVEAPSLLLVAVAYAVLLALAFGSRRLRLAALTAVLALSGWGAVRAARENRVRVDLLPSGAGSALFVNLPGSDDVLVDPGMAYESRRVLRHLRARGVDRLQIVVLSRSTVDVAGGLPELLAACPVREVWTVPPARSGVFRDVLEFCRTQGVTVRELGAGDSGNWPGRVSWEVLHPRGGTTYAMAADQALVLRLTRGTESLLFSGDGRASTEAEVLSTSVSPRSPLWVVGRVGADDLGTADWLRAVSPSQIILRATATLGAAAEESILERLLPTGAVVDWLTDDRRAELELRAPGADARATPALTWRMDAGWLRR